MAEKTDNGATRFKGKTTKVCENCGVENPNATQKCKGCTTEFVSKAVKRKELSISRMGKTSATHQRQLMEHRANILHTHHGQHIVIMALSKHGNGYSTYLHGTQGPAERFVEGKGNDPGRIVQRLFDNYMRNELRKSKNVQSGNHPPTETTNISHTQTTASAGSTTATTATTTAATTTTTTAATATTAAAATTTAAEATTAAKATTTTTTTTPKPQLTISVTLPVTSDDTETEAPTQLTTLLTPTTTAALLPQPTASRTLATSSELEPVTKHAKTSEQMFNVGTSKRMVKRGSKLWVLDKNKKPQAVCKLFSLQSTHNKTIPEGHVGIVIDDILPGCKLEPACPTPFDEDVIEKGAYYIWPLQFLAFHSD